jgi:hypothetical protein
MIKIKEDTKIYIVCQADLTTGGPEALHQMCDAFNSLGYNAFMYYVPSLLGKGKAEINPSYSKYNVRAAQYIDDSQDNLLITPEINTRTLYRYKKIRKAIYWLSIDNYYKSLVKTNDFKSFVKTVVGSKAFDINSDASDASINHLVQSRYAEVHLRDHGIQNVFHISDYLNDEYLTNDVLFDAEHRKNNVLYNPAKGIELTRKLMDLEPNLNWLPLKGYTPEEVAKILSENKVYVDFGNHPGKDRFPREAAMMGCCIITGKLGSANYFEDVPIPADYKFDDNDLNAIIKQIWKCIEQYNDHIKDFEGYRLFIVRHKETLFNQIATVFPKV